MKIKYLIDQKKLGEELAAAAAHAKLDDLPSLAKALDAKAAAMVLHVAERVELALEALTLEIRDYARLRMRFCGPYVPGTRYVPNDCTQRSGSLWIALVETTEPPGSSTAWREIGRCK